MALMRTFFTRAHFFFFARTAGMRDGSTLSCFATNLLSGRVRPVHRYHRIHWTSTWETKHGGRCGVEGVGVRGDHAYSVLSVDCRLVLSYTLQSPVTHHWKIVLGELLKLSWGVLS